MSVNHYENFPVASLLLPPHLRQAVAHIYHFARSADDLADEGDASAAERLASLAHYGEQLRLIETDITPADPQLEPLFRNLAETIRTHDLDIAHFHALLSAFAQDVSTTRYADFATLCDYCNRSANPVGRLMLQLYGAATPGNLEQADAICTALQLINFWQDVALDWYKGRVYLPQEDLVHFGVGESSIATASLNTAWRALMAFEVERTRRMMLAGAPLARQLPGRIGWELRLVIQGGLRILEKIKQVDYDVFHHRPQLRAFDWIVLVKRALFMRTLHDLSWN